MRVQNIIYYPIKSCKGIEVEQSVVEPRGLENDRRLMVVYATGRFLTQRDKPALALVEPKIDGGSLSLQAPGMERISIALNRDGKERTVDVWNDSARAVDQGEVVAEWLSTFLRTNCRLVQIGSSFERKARVTKGTTTDVSFADHYPLVITTQESLDYLNERLEEPLMMSQMRPNVVLAGGEPFEEYQWQTLSIGTTELIKVEDCERCALTLINQDTASKGREPLKILTSMRIKPFHRAVFGIHAATVESGVIAKLSQVQISKSVESEVPN